MRLFIAVVCIAALLTGCTPQSQTAGGKVYEASDPEGKPFLGKAAEDFTVKDLAGKSVKLSDMKGKVVLIDLWATWCGPCVQSMPNNQKLYDKHPEDLAIMAISGEDQGTVQAFVKESKFTFPIYTDAAQDVAMHYNVQAIPTVIVLDRDQNVVAYLVGADHSKVEEALKTAGLAL